VETGWSWIYNWDIAHTGLFEAHVASFSFVFSIAAWSVAHLVLGEEKTKKSRLDGQIPQEDPLSWAQFTWEEGARLWFNPLVSYLASIWIYQQIFHTHQPLPALGPSFGILVCEVFFGVFLYDLLFFPVHYAMHKAPFKAVRGVHSYHHRHTNGGMNSIETVQHSFIDGTLQVMVNILVQHISPFGGPKHMLSRIIHNVMVTYMLAESHSGYNLPWMSHNVWPEFLGGSPRHDRHHHDGRVYYQQFFMYLDDAMGLTDQEVQEQVKQKGADRLKLKSLEAVRSAEN
jgi:sterol desaturase/sphingolipid hydroxylase (fatty acid hydroxylase superfamily)